LSANLLAADDTMLAQPLFNNTTAARTNGPFNAKNACTNLMLQRPSAKR
jgi:hypothetical protein